LFGYEFSSFVKRLHEELIIAGRQGGIFDGLEKGNYFVNGAIFVLMTKDVESVSRLRIAVFNAARVFLVA
jgi:hypothetical protein